jgi:hemolysin III
MEGRTAITLEEFVNVATHGIGLAASLAALPVLVWLAARAGDATVVAGVSIFAVTLVIAYAASTVYHAMPPGPRKRFWRRVDQAAVYLLIAGTYTPLAVGALRGSWGWTLLVIVWLAAAIGIGAKLGLSTEAPTLETVTYLAMGWLAVVAIHPILERMGWAGFLWLLAGGVAYTVGTVFLVCQSRMRFGHCAWHVFVLGGSICHAIAIVNYAVHIPA